MNSIEDIRKHSLIVCAMTSWKKRISNCYTVVTKLLNQTVRPDRVYLTLSSDEFSRKNEELPKNLVELSKTNKAFIINWVKENTKPMKKVFPILQYLNDDDFIINCDDDMDFPNDFIECRLNEFISNGCVNPISGGNNPKFHRKKIGGIYYESMVSPGIFQKKMLKDEYSLVDDELISTYNDDYLYTLLILMNGYRNIPTTVLSKHTGIGPRKIRVKNDNDALGRNKVYESDNNVLSIFERKYLNKVGRIFENDLKHNYCGKRYDCVMPYTSCGKDSKALTCGNHLEIEYVIASLKKYCSSWVGRIFIVGSKPPEAIKNDVIHIPCDDPYTHCKDANIIHKLRYACEHIPDLSEDFLMISDDQIVTRASTWDDMKPRILKKYDEWPESKWEMHRKINSWHEDLYNTLHLFPKDRACFWEPHIWSPMNKYKFIDMCKKYDYAHSNACISQSLYYNFVNQPIVKNYDHIHIDNKALPIIKDLNKSNVKRHLSWVDKAFEDIRFRNLLDEIVGFKPPKDIPVNPPRPKSTSSKVNTISKLRSDIESGRVIKVPTVGGFIWKRVK